MSLRNEDMLLLIGLISTVITPVTLLYILFFLLSFGRRHIQAYNRSKVLRFTQEEVKEIHIKIDKIREGGSSHGMKILSLINHFNEISVGINEGLYDEVYVKMSLGYDMMDFYKKFRANYESVLSDEKVFTEGHKLEYYMFRFLPLELLLKKWDDGGEPIYKLNDRRSW